MLNKRFIIIILISFSLLLIPFLAMQFTTEVNWTAADFIVAGGLLVATGVVLEIILRKTKSINYRIGLVITVLIILILIWVELAVGIFGTQFSGN